MGMPLNCEEWPSDKMLTSQKMRSRTFLAAGAETGAFTTGCPADLAAGTEAGAIGTGLTADLTGAYVAFSAYRYYMPRNHTFGAIFATGFVIGFVKGFATGFVETYS